MDYLGIDVGKAQLHAELLQGSTSARKSIPNNAKGYEQLVKWLTNRKATEVHICLEATGVYGEPVAEFLHDHGYRVSVVNPMQIKSFGRSKLVRTKTDRVDAGLIAEFCRVNAPSPWNPPKREIRVFRAMVRRRETLSAMITAERNRLEAAVEPAVRRSLETTIAALLDELKRLESEIDAHVDGDPDLRDMVDRLDEIPGVGRLTAEKLVAETSGFSVCHDRRAIVAYAGLNPQHYQSGSVWRRDRISKIGNRALRKALFYAALTAKNRSPHFRPFVERLEAAGKRPKVIIVALMRKLLVLAHTLVKTNTRFESAYAA